MGELFTQYINGENSDVIAIGKSTLQNDGTVISWLSKGLQALNLHVPFKPREPISPIKSITIGDFALAFDPGTSWTPSAESRTVQAFMALPFGFNVSIGQIQNDLNITQGGMAVAGLATPIGASTSNIKVNNASDTSGMIDIVIQNTNLSCPASQHPIFSSFNAALTNQKSAEFYLVGNSKAVASMSIGQITLDPIKVNVSTQLLGLQGLKGLTTIDSVDVLGGTPDAINLGISGK
ncbi:hypothetical protein PHLCEN_2v2497 [Hermanssonia centrifuga]|uniref:Uncharacterized protein n=1 Tax=Hermanssonia centrifuga TaxID=98765 RepID=A0A2R6RLS9_9APHY|nr:hypothetical protein PHLCEN_2v2497 [Hermanssonia centrifuga]